MKLTTVSLLIAYFLSGCGANDHLQQDIMQLRTRIMEAECCTFESVITADYGVSLYTFQMECTADNRGNLEFTVTDPVSISGITGIISETTSALTFDDKILTFPMLADDQLTPVSTPWLFMNALKEGYIAGYSNSKGEICIYIDDSYAGKPILVEVYTDDTLVPLRTEIFWDQQRILSADIRKFTIL